MAGRSDSQRASISIAFAIHCLFFKKMNGLCPDFTASLLCHLRNVALKKQLQKAEAKKLPFKVMETRKLADVGHDSDS